MKRRTCLALCAGSFIGGGFAFPNLARASVAWTCYSFCPAATLVGARGMQKIVDNVKQATNGELEISVNLAGSLPINTTTITQAVGDGVMQMGDDGLYQGNVPIAGILQMPMLFNTPKEFAAAIEVMWPYIGRAYAKKGALLLGSYNYPLQMAWSRSKLESLADLRGQRMRVGSPEGAAFVQAFGGIPVTQGAEEVPSALDRGVIQGVFTASAGGGKIWHDLLKYCYRLGPNFFNGFIIANQEAYAKLPADMQGALKSAVAEVTPWETATLAKEEDEVTEQLRKGGIIFSDAKPDDVKLGISRMEPYWDKWAKTHGSEAEEALKKVRVAIGR